MEIDTLSMGDGKFAVNLFYPRIEGNPSQVEIYLFDVRASDSILIEFDFPRNGWVIKSPMLDPDPNWNEEYEEPEPKEVAFITAWPGAKEKTDGSD